MKILIPAAIFLAAIYYIFVIREERVAEESFRRERERSKRG